MMMCRLKAIETIHLSDFYWCFQHGFGSVFASATILISLPLLGNICILKILCILITQLEVHILHSFFDSLLAADANDRAHTLLDTP